mgnify:CR=1 FL=1
MPTVVIAPFVTISALSFIITAAVNQIKPPVICRYHPSAMPALISPNPTMRVTVATHLRISIFILFAKVYFSAVFCFVEDIV